MREFDHQLLRLKSALGVTSDQEVAASLGMTKAAFSDRKKRGAFPEDKLLALVARRPDLVVDPQYVLTGMTAKDRFAAENGRMPASYQELTQWVMSGQPFAAQPNSPTSVNLPPDEQLLLEAYRGLAAPARKALLAELLTGGKKPKTPKAGAAPAANTQNVKKGVGQQFNGPVGSVTSGDVVNKRKSKE